MSDSKGLRPPGDPGSAVTTLDDVVESSETVPSILVPSQRGDRVRDRDGCDGGSVEGVNRGDSCALSKNGTRSSERVHEFSQTGHNGRVESHC